MVHAYESSGQRWTRYALWIYVTLVLVFLMAPILIIVPLSFSAGSFLYFPLPGLSLRWYADFFTSDLWLPSLRNSLIVGIGATILATLLGTLAAFGFWRARFAGRRLLFALLLSPQVVPLIIVAVGVYFAFAPPLVRLSKTGKSISVPIRSSSASVICEELNFAPGSE